MAVKRDLAAEQRAVGQFKAANGNRMPTLSDPKDRANLYRLAYPPAAGGLPDELKATVDQSLYSATGMASAADAAPLDALKAGVDNTRAVVENAPSKNEALRVLQEAVRAKSGIANQPIGESSLFKELGVTGMGALSASLQAQGDKLETDYAFLQNKIKEGTDAYISYNDKIVNNYKMAYEEYKDAADRAERAAARAEQYKHDSDMIDRKAAIDREFEAWKMKNVDIDDAIKAQNSGLVRDSNGNWINKSDTVITSPSGNSYDWSTYNAPGGLDYIKDVQAKINSVGKLNNYADLAAYINKNMSGSSVTPIDIMNVSEKTGVGWEELLAILQKESIGGTSNVAKNNNNFGGITWSQSYQNSHPNVTKGTARPANEGGNYVKFKTVEDGLMAQAEQFAKRKVDNKISSDPASKLSPLARQIYMGEASMDGITPTEQTKIKKEIAAAGLVLQNLSVNDKARVDKIVGQFDNEPLVKEYNTIQGNAMTLKTLGNSPTDDMARIYAFAKVMDPNSAVKEGEYQTIQEYSTALLQKYGLKAKKVFSNTGFLTEQAREFINKTIESRAATATKQYKNVFDENARKIDMITNGNGAKYLTDYSASSGQSTSNNDPLGLRN